MKTLIMLSISLTIQLLIKIALNNVDIIKFDSDLYHGGYVIVMQIFYAIAMMTNIFFVYC